MKTVYELSALANIFVTKKANDLTSQLQEYIKKNMNCVTEYGECFVSMNIDNFISLTGTVYLSDKKVFSLKTYKPIKYIYTVCAYKLAYSTRKTVWDDYTVIEEVSAKILDSRSESVYTDRTQV